MALTTKEAWDKAFEQSVPIVSAGIGTLSLVVGIITLSRANLGQRVYYEDGQYLVAVREPGQWNNICDFIQPHNPDVIAAYFQYGPTPWNLFDLVCQSLSYRRDIGEFWQTPSETLARGEGDCEDSSILLTSLIRSGGYPVHTALGDYQGYGHAWCEYNGQILETTYTRARLTPDPQHYTPLVLFDERDLIELHPGALDELFSLQRNEELKLSLMGGVVDGFA